VTTISKRDAMKLVADIRIAHVSGHAIAARTSGGYSAAMYGFLGGLESVLRHFLLQHGCSEAATALQGAMNDTPAEAEIAARNAEVARFCSKAAGSQP
jgi:hypothetical protein